MKMIKITDTDGDEWFLNHEQIASLVIMGIEATPTTPGGFRIGVGYASGNSRDDIRITDEEYENLRVQLETLTRLQ